jgi:hypothetical protein
VAGLALANSAAFTAGAVLLALPSRIVAWATLWKGALQISAGAVPAGAIMWIGSVRLPAPAEGSADLGHAAILVGVVAAAAVVTVVMYQLVGLPFVRQLTTRRRVKPAEPQA